MSESVNLLLLLPMIALAGFIDSIAGGGGLVSLTSYHASGLAGAFALGNNKFSSTFGTLVALAGYARSGNVRWRLAVPSALMAVAGSHIGAELALRFSSLVLSWMMLVMLPVLTLLVLRRPGKGRVLSVPPSLLLFLSCALSFFCGLYDGFFGPGTGMFLTLGFSFLGLSLRESAGITKVVNAASNISALVTFMLSGSVIYAIGVPAALASIAGNALGAYVAVHHGDRAIRPLLVVVIALLYIDLVISLL